MSAALIPLIALLVLPIILLLAFTGCTGEDPRLGELEKENEALKDDIDKKDKEADDAKKAADAAAEAAKYENVIGVESKLVSYWRLDEGETGDTTAKDSAPFPRDGEYKFLQAMERGQTGALSTTKHPGNRAVEFKGTQGYVEVGYDSLRNPPHSFTVELWMKPEGTSTDPQVLVGSYELAPAGHVARGFVLDVVRTPGLRVRGRLGNGAGQPASIEADLGDGTMLGGWRHVVMAYNHPAQSLKLYVNADDGKPDAELPNPSSPAGVAYEAVADTTVPLRIAAGQSISPPGMPGGTPPTVDQFYEGRIDEVALYNGDLDGGAVLKHIKAATA